MHFEVPHAHAFLSGVPLVQAVIAHQFLYHIQLAAEADLRAVLAFLCATEQRQRTPPKAARVLDDRAWQTGAKTLRALRQGGRWAS